MGPRHALTSPALVAAPMAQQAVAHGIAVGNMNPGVKPGDPVDQGQARAHLVSKPGRCTRPHRGRDVYRWFRHHALSQASTVP